jgi:hypothetical protein
MHRFVAAGVLMIGLTIAAQADEKKDAKKDEPRKGTVAGVVTANDGKSIEIKADGEEKARKYIPHWRGGNPAQGGGPDKDMIADIKKTPVKSRVRIEWEFEEHFRVLKIEILKKADAK